MDKQKQFADGSPIEIWYSYDGRERKIVEGVVSRNGNTTIVDGRLYEPYRKSGSYDYRKPEDVVGVSRLLMLAEAARDASNRAQYSGNNCITGRFSIQNTADGKLKADKKNEKVNGSATPLTIDIVSLDEYNCDVSFNGRSIPVHAIAKDDGEFYVTVQPDAMMRHWKKRAKLIETAVESLDRLTEADWHVVFENGDEWFGPFGDATAYNHYISGEYRLSKGDVIKGEFNASRVFGDEKWPDWTEPDKFRDITEIDLADGHVIIPREWISSLDAKNILGQELLDQLYRKSLTPTDLRDNIVAELKKKTYEKEQAELKKKQEEQEKLIQEQKKLERYIAKYGQKYGKLVAEKRVEQGMTRQMIKEFLPEEWYVVTRSGNTETWRFSDSKVEQSMYNTKNTLEVAMMARMFGTSVSQLIRTAGGLGLSDVPRVIKFTGGKITSITK